MAAHGAGEEWQRGFSLPLAAALGYAMSVIHIYGLGPYIEPVSAEFGWSRTQTALGLTIQTLIAAVCAVPIGIAVDRVGPRMLGLIGIVLTAGAFALISTASGTTGNWIMLWCIMAFAALPVQATIWTGAVASRFQASRGMALAVTLCGASLAQAIFPYLATRLILAEGWRTAMVMQAGIWLAIALPAVFFFFKGARDFRATIPGAPVGAAPVLAGVSLGQGMGSSIYWRLMLASLLFTFTIIALVVNFVPILTDRGMDKLAAAGLAALIGLSSIAGRLGTGFLLDRLRGSLVGAGAFLLPAFGCLILIASGANASSAALAAILIGLTLGAEIDVIVYLTTKHFGLRNFGGLYGGLLTALSIGTALGPLAASAVFDRMGSYSPFLWLTIAFMVASSLALASLPSPAFAGEDA